MRRNQNIEHIMAGEMEMYAANEQPNPRRQGRKHKKARPEDTKRYKAAAKQKQAAAA